MSLQTVKKHIISTLILSKQLHIITTLLSLQRKKEMFYDLHG